MVNSDVIGFAIFNNFKTGNGIVDSFLVILISTIISVCLANIYKIQMLYNIIIDSFDNKYIIWNIDDSGTFNLYGYSIGFDFHNNNILREAIMSYIGSLNNTYKKNELKFLLSKYDQSMDNYKNNILPSERNWFKVNDFVECYYHTNIVKDKKNIQFEKNVKLRTKYNVEHLNILITNSINYYKKNNYEDKTLRYMYMMYKEEDKEIKEILWKKYLLNYKKTFSSLFFPEKDDLLQLVDNFIGGMGKYSIPTYPKKLGLLLHGPPGTGKTSLIKALSSYTNRHIVIIPISRIETNQQLFDMLFDNSFKIKDKPLKEKFAFKDLIFIIEDIDAATDITEKREENIIEKNTEKSKEITLKNFLSIEELKKDKLTLSGVLNALDGILESENRMIVITTNHIEKLDPALIRPGRIDKILNLTYTNNDSAEKIIKLYFPDQASNNIDFSFFEKKEITPASIEQKCSEYTNIQDVVDYFRKLG